MIKVFIFKIKNNNNNNRIRLITAVNHGVGVKTTRIQTTVIHLMVAALRKTHRDLEKCYLIIIIIIITMKGEINR